MFDLPRPILIGMVHLPPLPGSPRASLKMDELIDRACTNARVLAEAGFGAVLVENFGDVPFLSAAVGPMTVAAMAVAIAEVRKAVPIPIGVNVLRNDARAAMAVATASGAAFIRVNLHLGLAATDQGLLSGSADRTLRLRRAWDSRIAILADVHVKHAVQLSQPDIALAAEEVAYRGLADGLIVSGATTGRAVELEDLRSVKRAVPDRPLLVGSGATAETIAQLLAHADGAIVGTSLKVDGKTEAPVDPGRALAFIRAARSLR